MAIEILECRHTASNHNAHTTGYGYTMKDGDLKHRSCFECCGVSDIEYMREHGRNILYLTVTDIAIGSNGMPSPPTRKVKAGDMIDGYVGNWGTDGLKFPCHGHVGYHNIAGRRYDVWFPFDGQLWHGVQYGDMTQIVHCRRTKQVTDMVSYRTGKRVLLPSSDELIKILRETADSRTAAEQFGLVLK